LVIAPPVNVADEDFCRGGAKDTYMLRIRPDDSSWNFVHNRQSFELGRLILRTSTRLADCRCEEIEEIIHTAVDSVCSITSAEMTGWFFLSPSGDLTDVFHFSDNCALSDSILSSGLRKLPWCSARLDKGKAVVLCDANDLVPAAGNDYRSLSHLGIRSIAFLPSGSSAANERLLVLSSTFARTYWSSEVIDQCALLESIFFLAYQRKLERSTSERTRSLVVLEDITGQKTAELELNKSRSEVKTLASQLIELQENERKRLSRELHDDIGQRLSLVASEVALLQRQHSSGPAGLGARLGTLREDLDGLCTDLHCLSHSLHSYKLQHLGLKSALKDLCRQMSQPDFHIDLIVDDSEDPKSKDVSLCLYRVAQEALNNALRHAQTSFVAVTLTKLQHTFYMAIQDLGIGFETSTSPQGLGLISMKERLKLVNGQLILHSILGRGTEIWVAIPDADDTSDHEDDLQYSSISSQDEAA
jgi:signal transduction histidine kinase